MLNNLKLKVARFMYGRYGADHLYIAGGILFIVLQVVQIFARSSFLSVLSLVLMIWTFYRAFSRNYTARRAENQKFLEVTRPLHGKVKLLKRRIQDIQTHRYRECPECKTTLRLPRKKGTHKANCPKCSTSFEVKIRV